MVAETSQNIFDDPLFVAHLDRLWYMNTADFDRLCMMVMGWDLDNLRVLDVGCGTGRMAKLFRRATWEGVDSSPEMVRICTEKGLNAHQQSIFSLPYNNASIDLVLCHAVVFHVGNWAGAVKELWRVAKSRLIFTSYYSHRPWPLNDLGVVPVWGEDPSTGKGWFCPKHAPPAWQIKRFIRHPKHLGVKDARLTWIDGENNFGDQIVYCDLRKEPA